ncbi:MAG: hypothetical protein NZ891_08565, partial [bacterium]|nr:hypothetical protein [bacterium]MDW8164774.1 uroporphyrinogen decarboxylase family protein [Candidatus Omnitrophota bacterium]
KNSYRAKVSLVKGAMAMLQYFNDLGIQVKRMKEEINMPSAICGILKAPLDIIADKLRGYIGLVMDLHTQPDKVLKACEILAPHLTKIAMMTADPEKKLPIGFWMHRGCVPFINMEHFKLIYWPTLKPIIEELWKNGYQTLFYAEGNWDAHLDSFAELPEKSIIYHVDRGDIFKVHKKLGNKFCISGGLPNTLLCVGTEKEVKNYCKKIIDNVAKDGGYIMDASAIIQNDAKIENIKVMTEFTREYGIYSQGHNRKFDEKEGILESENKLKNLKIKPGVCIPWEEKKKEIIDIKGDENLIKRIWEEIDTLGYIFIWQILLSF